MTSAKSHERKAETLLLLVVLIYAMNYSAAKYSMAGMGVLVFNAFRYTLAALTLILLQIFTSSWKRIERADWMPLLRAGFVTNIVYQITFVGGLSLTSAGNYAVLIATSPLWALYINAKLHKEKIKSAVWIGMAVSVLGVSLIVIGSGKKLGLGEKDIAGDCLALVAAFLWALGTNLQKPLLEKFNALQLAVIMLSTGAIGLSMAALPGLMQTYWESIAASYYGAAVFSGVFSVAGGAVMWAYGIFRLGPARTANFNNLVPVLAIVLAFFLLHERLYAIEFIGAAVTIAGVWYARKMSAPAEAELDFPTTDPL